MKVKRFGLKNEKGYLSCTEKEQFSNFVDDAIYWVDFEACLKFFQDYKQFTDSTLKIVEFTITFPRLLPYRIFA